jgi:DNA-binding CsgD family transcriptional regulator
LRQHELDILGRLNLGMPNQEIANELAIAVTALKWRLSQIFCKLQVRNRIEAAAHTRLQLERGETAAALHPWSLQRRRNQGRGCRCERFGI